MTRSPFQAAARTEGPVNSYRHNRVRETELFRHFMPYGHMYAHEEGSYGYGSYSPCYWVHKPWGLVKVCPSHYY